MKETINEERKEQNTVDKGNVDEETVEAEPLYNEPKKNPLRDSLPLQIWCLFQRLLKMS